MRFLALVAIALVAGDRLLGALCAEVLQRSHFRFSELYRGNLNAEIVILGSSRAVHSLYAPTMTARLCASTLHLGFNAMSAEVSEAILRDYLERNGAPRAVFLEVSNVTGDDSILKAMKAYVPQSANLRELFQRRDPRTLLIGDTFSLYYYNSELFLRALHHLRKDDQQWILRDFAIRSPEEREAFRSQLADLKFDIDGEEVAAFRRTIAFLNRHEIGVVPYLAPFHPIVAEAHPEIVRWVAEVQHSLSPQHVVDGSLSLRDDHEFADTYHLNIDGSESFLSWLLEQPAVGAPIRSLGCDRRRSGTRTASVETQWDLGS